MALSYVVLFYPLLSFGIQQDMKAFPVCANDCDDADVPPVSLTGRCPFRHGTIYGENLSP